MEHPNQGKVCKCPHHQLIPALVTLGGAFFFFGSLGVLTTGFTNVAISLFVVIGGLSVLFEGGCKCC